MGLRFRKSIKILPGVRINYGLHSTSVSVGGKGFHTTYSSTGRVTRSVGIPGTGLSYVTTSSGRSQSAPRGKRMSGKLSSPLPVNELQVATHQQPAFTNSQTNAVNVEKHREIIQQVYRCADTPVDWRKILISDSNPGIEQWDYFKARAEDVLNGNLDTYFEIISDINPVDDLLQYGSEFECGTDDPRMLTVEFQVNSDSVLRDALSLNRHTYYDLLQDYVCGCAIRVARDMFALLPLRHIIINALDHGVPILSVDFDRKRLDQIVFTEADASDTIQLFEHRMDFDLVSGFGRVQLLEE